MDFLTKGLAAILDFLSKVFAAMSGQFLANDLKAWAPKLIDFFINVAVRQLPEHLKERYAQEWPAHVVETPGEISKILCSIGFVFAGWWVWMDAIGEQVRFTAEISIIIFADLVTALRASFLAAAGMRAAGFAITTMRLENLLHANAATPFARVYINPSKSDLIPGATCPKCGRKINWSDPVSGPHKTCSKIVIITAPDPNMGAEMHCPFDGSFTVRAKDFYVDTQNTERVAS
jgi:hypothetical protein